MKKNGIFMYAAEAYGWAVKWKLGFNRAIMGVDISHIICAWVQIREYIREHPQIPRGHLFHCQPIAHASNIGPRNLSHKPLSKH